MKWKFKDIFNLTESKSFFTYYWCYHLYLSQVGISRLVEEGAFNAAFPLHDVSADNIIIFIFSVL